MADKNNSNLREDERSQSEIELSADIDKPIYFALLKDFSLRGFRAVFYKKYSKGDILAFNLKGPKSNFRCQGEIMWIEKQGFFSKTYMAGVHIIGNILPKKFQEEIKSFQNNE